MALPWWEALKKAVIGRNVPSSIAERITDCLAGFVLARDTTGTESQRARAWFRRLSEHLRGRKISYKRRTFRMLFTDVCALVARELRRVRLDNKKAAVLISKFFVLVNWEAQAKSIERSLRRSAEKRILRNR